MWFFSEDNIEVLVKVLDGCRFTDSYWVFASATTDVGLTLRVTDLLTGVSKEYFNLQGETAKPIQDTTTFQACE